MATLFIQPSFRPILLCCLLWPLSACGGGGSRPTDSFDAGIAINPCSDKIRKLYAVPGKLPVSESTTVQLELLEGKAVDGASLSLASRGTGDAVVAELSDCAAGASHCWRVACEAPGDVYLDVVVERDRCEDTEQLKVVCERAEDDDGGVADDGGMEDDGDASVNSVCPPVTAEALPARASLVGDAPPPSTVREHTLTELWNQFNQHCGGCHGGNDPLGDKGVFRVAEDTLAERPNLAQDAAERIASDDPDFVMPPQSPGASELSEDHPYRVLARWLLAWDEQGKGESFFIDEGAAPVGPQEAYRLSDELAGALTNIGSCLPDPKLPRRLDAMHDKDAMFAAVRAFDDLPKTLYETDLVSLDSGELARYGVYSYAPTYTLFSDDAGKMRHVRVPVGQTIAYNRDQDRFDIPDNTRFYKTFVKEVIDKAGNRGFRKMETRLIVARRDRDLPGGGVEIRAIRATYAWDKNEQYATLVTDPLRNDQPFADRLCPYIVDERATRDKDGDGVVDQEDGNPISPSISEKCDFMDADELRDPASGTIRHYAIPGITRCDECHMGSRSQSYILGFTPWHADRRRDGEGGVYDLPPTEDELSQLQRLIDYGVVSGIAPGEAKLEESQGERAPRNDHELRAQAYMLSNCAFCHNDRGFPTRQNEVLRPFNLMPDRGAGGIFQFSLERTSPRAAHLYDNETVPIPYITSAFGPNDRIAASGAADADLSKQANFQGTLPVLDAETAPDVAYDTFVQLAPWRSLIWRNVYTPFTYTERDALFIHMPRNVPGFDVRAHQIMASWMLSIPSRPKQTPEPLTGDDLNFAWMWKGAGTQPVEEVLPDDPDYAEAEAAGQARVEAYLEGLTGQHVPPRDDIVDPDVLTSPVRLTPDNRKKKERPAPVDDARYHGPKVNPEFPQPNRLFQDGVPSRAHWVWVDTTEPTGQWRPRRTNWRELIAVDKSELADASLQRTIDHLREVRLSAAQASFSLEPVPLGLWLPACANSPAANGAPTVGELQKRGPQLMHRWLSDPQHKPSEDAKVHAQPLGEAVFSAICQNCHGTNGDSKSPLTTTVLELSGGETRVANFVDGIFGPRSNPGYNAEREFFIPGSDASPAEWQARYMMFMALGGTEATIPQAVVNAVGVSPFYGRAPRTGALPGEGGAANMLQSAEHACRQILETNNAVQWHLTASGPYRTGADFVAGTGHYEMWESLCSYRNEPLIRVFVAASQEIEHYDTAIYRSRTAEGDWVYPQTELVGDQYGRVARGIQEDNVLPWCVKRGLTPDEQANLESKLSSLGYDEVPWCPEGLFERRYRDRPGGGHQIHQFPTSGDLDVLNGLMAERWYRQGAINAGLAAYHFLDRWTKGELARTPAFDECEEGGAP